MLRVPKEVKEKASQLWPYLPVKQGLRKLPKRLVRQQQVAWLVHKAVKRDYKPVQRKRLDKRVLKHLTAAQAFALEKTDERKPRQQKDFKYQPLQQKPVYQRVAQYQT